METIKTGCDLIIDAGASGGLNPLVSESGSQAGAPQWIIGDAFDLRVRFVQASADTLRPFVETRLPGSWALVFVLKKAPQSKEIFASAMEWGLSVEGDKTFYTSFLNLNTDALVKQFEFENSQLELWAEIEVQDASGVRRLSFQWKVKINQQVYRGEVVPAPEEQPAYPAPGAIPVRLVGSVPIPEGSTGLHIPVEHTRDYIPVAVVNAPGQAAPLIFCRTREVTREGFYVDFSSTVKQGGYYVNWIGF